jgi:HlyD family secretion protein
MVVVETGISDDNYLEIKKGIAEGDEVISGSYRAISRELENDSVIRVEKKKGGPGEGMAESNENN